MTPGARAVMDHAQARCAAQDAFDALAADATARRRLAFDAAYIDYRAAQRRADAIWHAETAEARLAFELTLEQWPAAW